MSHNKILNLAGRSTGSPIRSSIKNATEAEIIIYAGIGQDWWGDGSMISAKDFSDEMKKIPDTVNKLSIRINSGGGDVFDGITIYNRIRDFSKKTKAKVVVHIDGLAASIASIIALAGDEIVMGDAALYMIHLPWTMSWGNRMDFDNTVNRLMDVEEQMLGIYVKKTGLDRSELRAMLEKETWLGADEAIDKGFVDKKADETMPIAASAIASPWIVKKPQGYYSETKAAQEKMKNIKDKIASTRLARK